MVNFREIKDLVKLMNENDLNEVEVEYEGTKIKLKKGADGIVVSDAKPVIQQAPVAPAAASQDAPAKAESAPTGQTIKSPMVGTFYASPSPDADPFIKVGSKVSVGQVVCIVEAMKLMNEIKSEISGTITEVHSQNGEPVEFGQALFFRQIRYV